jgi:hypothetical protein
MKSIHIFEHEILESVLSKRTKIQLNQVVVIIAHRSGATGGREEEGLQQTLKYEC